MDKIIWSKDFSVGNIFIDEQHKKIIELINILVVHHNASVHSENLAYVINELMLYSQHHLDYEEKLLEELQYPGLTEHKEVHLKYRKEITDFAKKVTNYDKEMPIELLEFLKDWWFNHILKEDMAYKPFLKKSRNTSSHN